jgi:hypothetical protein
LGVGEGGGGRGVFSEACICLRSPTEDKCDWYIPSTDGNRDQRTGSVQHYYSVCPAYESHEFAFNIPGFCHDGDEGVYGVRLPNPE